ncbi:hypothetical protein QBC39DRAFT_334017 [Podospora conica]|nr:hypothetical protein QBC39DRAFT_334017 [Schizothecium conicum]
MSNYYYLKTSNVRYLVEIKYTDPYFNDFLAILTELSLKLETLAVYISREALTSFKYAVEEGLKKKDNLEDYLLDRGNTSEAKCIYPRIPYSINGYPTGTSSKVLISILPGINKYPTGNKHPTGTSSKLLTSILLIDLYN